MDDAPFQHLAVILQLN